MSPARRLLRYLRRYRLRYACGAVCLLLATVFSLGIPWTVKAAVDALGASRDLHAMVTYAAIIVALAVAHGAARLGSRFTMIGAGQWVEHDLRRDLYARLLRLPATFYHSHRTGDLMSRASSDISAVRTLAGFGTTMLTSTSLAFAGTLVAMWSIDPRLTLYALAPSPVLILAARRFSRSVERQSTAVQEQLGALSAKVQENLAGIAVVRAYTMEQREIAGFGRLNGEYLTRSARLARTQAGFWPLMGLISGMGTLIILWLGGKAVVDGRITLGAFVAFNGYLAYLAWPTVALGWTLGNLQRGLSAMQRIAEVLDAPAEAEPDGAEAGDARRLPRGGLQFSGLSFAYEGRAAPALRDVSFTVPEGAFAVVVGATGSGKSTLGALVCRLFEPPRGTLFVGGTDVRELPVRQLRRTVGYVPQEAFLFSRSLRDNLLLGDGAAGHERLSAAAAAAGLAAEVEGFPEGWDTVVGERGLTLSGGQRQRAALARALVGEPAFLVLDDPFASVDPGKEWEILQALRGARRGRTTLLMTHRLLAAEEADLVVVLDDGEVVEQGRHADLLAAGGAYARLWRIQQIESELEPD
ncbi:MAG: ABC transporter ATP-binding protein [Candidatus Rokubacteria bacterium]|nr:ABC transporter ATP-binding protein [Candidatus Rokubacteria bacterium]